jgi:hypothetical protein
MAGGACLIVAAGCGQKRQDASEKAGDYHVVITGASFPAKQSIADATTMKISVRNNDNKTLPDVAITVATEPGSTGGAPQAFSEDISDPNVADASRPIWIIDKGPEGGDSAYTNTWALGPLKAGQTKDFEWHVTAVKPGSFAIDYSVSPGLNGKAKAASGATKGTFRVNIDDRPPNAKVGNHGQVIRAPAGSNP